MEKYYLSYLMGATEIADSDLKSLNIQIEGKTESGSRTIKVPAENLSQYLDLVKAKLDNGFWNEVVGESEIIFIFKFKDGKAEEYSLSPENERQIDKLCAEFNNEPPDKTANVYKYLSENDFYHDFIIKNHSALVNR